MGSKEGSTMLWEARAFTAIVGIFGRRTSSGQTMQSGNENGCRGEVMWNIGNCLKAGTFEGFFWS